MSTWSTMEHLDPELLSAYIDAELSPGEMAQVEEHLASCPTCIVEYQELLGIATMVRELPTYQPRTVVEIDRPRSAAGSGSMSRIIEFSKPLAVAALILLIAFAGLQLLSDIGDDEETDGDQISFSAVQETATDGTDPAARTSESIAAGERAPDAAGAPPEQSGDSAETTMQEAPSDNENDSEMAPAAAAPEQVEATATAPAAATAPPDDDGDSRLLLIAGVVAVVVVVAGSAAWYAFFRSPRRPRS